MQDYLLSIDPNHDGRISKNEFLQIMRFLDQRLGDEANNGGIASGSVAVTGSQQTEGGHNSNTYFPIDF